MQLRFTKLDDRRHVLEVRCGERSERAELETRSTLHHDFTHLAVEELAPVDSGFFTALARGTTLAELASRAKEGTFDPVAMQVERAVAVLQGLTRKDEEPHVLHARIVESLAVQQDAPPTWFTPDFVAAVRARLHHLLGRWRATPYGGVMEVSWDRREPDA